MTQIKASDSTLTADQSALVVCRPSCRGRAGRSGKRSRPEAGGGCSLGRPAGPLLPGCGATPARSPRSFKGISPTLICFGSMPLFAWSVLVFSRSEFGLCSLRSPKIPIGSPPGFGSTCRCLVLLLAGRFFQDKISPRVTVQAVCHTVARLYNPCGFIGLADCYAPADGRRSAAPAPQKVKNLPRGPSGQGRPASLIPAESMA